MLGAALVLFIGFHLPSAFRAQISREFRLYLLDYSDSLYGVRELVEGMLCDVVHECLRYPVDCLVTRLLPVFRGDCQISVYV